ncbi:MAG: response regulator [Deltaproteobacteria bacterium]|nr:response regulator [Deltaproteobacteria bacterium]
MTAILVADHNQTVRMDLQDTFEAAGFRVFSCATAAEARTTLRTHPIALAVIDPAMSNGDGLALIEQIRGEAVLRELPVLALSRHEELGTRGELVAPCDCVGKPYERAYVIARARELVGAPPMRDSILVIAADVSSELIAALARAGFATELAGNGVDGLQAAATARPTAIVIGATTDLDRGVVIRRLRQTPALRTTPCLVIGAPAEEVKALEAGADAFVASASDPEMVLARVRALLRSSNALPSEGALPRVLMVDDDPDYLDILGSRLRKRGYDTLNAVSGEVAIKLLGEQLVDCILLDRTMTGMGGVATCRFLKSNAVTADIPVIFLTATEQREAVIEGLAAGADDFVSKAAGFDALAARIQAQLRRRHTEAEQREAREAMLRSDLAVLEARSAREVADVRAQLAEQLAQSNRELAAANRELESFGYSVAHDLRAPLRTIGLHTHAFVDRLRDQIDQRSLEHVHRVFAAATHMSDLIESLLELGRIQRHVVGRHTVDLTALARGVVDDLSRREPDRRVEHAIADELLVDADGRLLRVLLDNLIGNAWRFTTTQQVAHVELGVEHAGDERVFYVKDDGVGFDPTHAPRLFSAGVGLQTARRIVERHGGRIWAEGAPGAGAKFSFTLPG